MNISGIFTVKKAKRGSEFLNPENLKSINISGIFRAKKVKRGSEILNPVSRDLSFLHDFAEFYFAGFRFSDAFLQY